MTKTATTRMAAAFFLVMMTGAPSHARDGFRGPISRIAGRIAARRETNHSAPAAPAYAASATSDVQQASYVPSQAAPASTDPYGFVAVLNRYRASVGLHPVSVDHNLSSWARRNNVVQSIRGIGHHVSPNCRQNCAYNFQDAGDVFQGWLDSPGHRANMLSRDISSVGIAFGPGPYWTMNAR